MKKQDLVEETRKPSRELLKKCKYDLELFVKEMRKENERIHEKLIRGRKNKPRKAA